MAQTILHTLIFSLAFLFFSSSITSSSYQYQTLYLNPLPSSSPILSWPQPKSESESTTSLSLPISHIDDLSSTSADATPGDMFNLRLQRDSVRVKFLTSLAANATSGITSNVTVIPTQAEYYIRLGVGTPAKDVYLILDTGSDIVWLQCLPCKACYNQSDPIFNPAKSKSYSTVPCGSPVCRKLATYASSCVTGGNKTCLYEVLYSDRSQTKGDFATETLTFNGTSVDHFAFGCGHLNKGRFNVSAGIFGLGRGAASFVSQTKNRYNRKFSYCFVDWTTPFFSSKPIPSSTVMFGDDAIPKTGVFTPLLTNPNSKLGTFYYLQLLGISVGGSRVRGVTESQFKFDPTTGDGGVFIDSGATITRLAQSAYIPFRDAFRLATKNLKRIPFGLVFDTCYDLSGMTKVKLPTIVFHFAGGDVLIPPKSYLAPLNTPGRYCFSFSPILGNLSIIGNIHQQGFRISYDLVNSRIGFLPEAC